MKPGIHPEYHEALITCACGRVTETRSTQKELHVEICSHCHPFFTGRQKLVDTAGRVERFIARYGLGEQGREEAEAGAERDEEEAESGAAASGGEASGQAAPEEVEAARAATES